MYKKDHLCAMIQTNKNIVAIRKALRISQSELAFEYSIPQSSWSRLEKGERKVEIDLLQFLAGKFNMTIDEIVNYHISKPEKTQKEEKPVKSSTASDDIALMKKYIQLLENKDSNLFEIREEIDQLKKGVSELRNYLYEAVNALDDQIEMIEFKDLKHKIDLSSQGSKVG